MLEARQKVLTRLSRFSERASLARSDGMPPLITKDQLRDAFESFASPLLSEMPVWWKTTSGTSGRPVDIPYDSAFFLDFKYAAFHKAWQIRFGEMLGSRPYLAIVITDLASEPSGIYIDPLFSAGVIARIAIDVSKMEDVRSVLDLISTNRPQILSTKPSVIAAMTSASAECKPVADLILVGGAALQDHLRRAAQNLFSGAVASIYATSELGVIGSECAHGRMHIYESDLLAIDDHPSAPSQIVVSNISNEALPLESYQTGDAGTISTERCVCGLPWRWIERLEGRVTPLFCFSEGEILSPSCFNKFLRVFPDVREFQVNLVQGRKLLVNVEHVVAPSRELILSMDKFFRNLVPNYVAIQLVEQKFDPHEKFARYRILQ